MRTFFIVRGAPGIGKSTFLSLYQARGQVVSLDGIRDVFAMPIPDWDGVPGRSICGDTEGTISRVLESALRSRFEQGGDVFFDATNPELQQFKHLADMSRAYGYQVAVIDMQGNATDDMILAQNAKRAGSVTYVPEEDVLRISTRVREGTRECRRYAGRGMWVSAQWEERDCGLHLVNLDAMRDFVRSTIDGRYVKTITPKAGERVVIVGSAYGGAQPLSATLMEAWDATKDARAVTWVFLGDALASSPHVTQAWKILKYFETQAKQHGHTVIFLEGIDETILREILTRAASSHAFPDAREVIDAITRTGTQKRDLLRHLNNLTCALTIHTESGTCYVTTGGTANQDRTLTALECTNGANDRTSTYRRKTNYEDYPEPLSEAAARADITIIHGHRNTPHDMPRVVAVETGKAPGYVIL
jgi:predicted kinase